MPTIAFWLIVGIAMIAAIALAFALLFTPWEETSVDDLERTHPDG